MHETRLTQADNGRTIDLPSDSELIVSLPENPATGYTWAVDVNGNDTLRVLHSEYVPGADLAPGSGGQHLFRFGLRHGLQQPGLAQLRLKRWHAWEGDQSVVERFDVTVHVRH